MQQPLLAILAVMWFICSASTPPSVIRQLNANKNESFIRYEVKHRVKDISNNLRTFGSTALYDTKSKSIKDFDTAMKLYATTDKLIGAHQHDAATLTGVEQPCITYESHKVTQRGNFLDIKGVMSFHGVRKEVNILAPLTIEYGKITVNGEMNIKLTDFSIQPPRILTIPIEDNLKIAFKFVFNTF
jgi:hypothetical protein